ncbi:hypothetical protein H072_11061 [Dactylellina haptotyla CBS 200.50]|uniref:Uncharacterized protein n=1 Tax=Dactylellina haptotyla (strain CBS 200.50) TaxID=1284197 RepID=S8B906_DACHA|nr:hypothetical protein H072_11061 [Dactylellina haptotyla CBS 200.50]
MSDELFSGRNTQSSPKELFRYHAENALFKLRFPLWPTYLYPTSSPEYRTFVRQIGDVDDVIHTGCETLIDFLNKKVPQTLSKLYCMLHVCYAMSKSSSKDNPSMTEEAFSKSVKEWKNCLPVVSETGVREQDLFDEIRSVMWEEIKEAFEYVEDLLGKFENQQEYQHQESCHNLDFLNLDFLGDYHKPGKPKLCTDPPNDNEPPDISGHQGPLSPNKPIIANPSEPNPPLPPQLTPWDILFSNAIIAMALGFFKELGETGIVMLCACGSVLQTVFGSLGTGTSTNHAPRVDITYRRSILDATNKALSSNIYPNFKKILDRVAHPFLKGTIGTIYQLEKCMIELSKSLDLSPAAFKHFARSVICHFQYYYDDQLPAAFKHPSDVYNSPLYTSWRIWEETEWLADPPLPDTVLENPNVPQSRAQTISHTSPTITPVLKRSASLESENKENTSCKRKRPKKNTPEPGPPAKTTSLKIVKYDPARPKRQRRGAVLDSLPRQVWRVST